MSDFYGHPRLRKREKKFMICLPYQLTLTAIVRIRFCKNNQSPIFDGKGPYIGARSTFGEAASCKERGISVHKQISGRVFYNRPLSKIP